MRTRPKAHRIPVRLFTLHSIGKAKPLAEPPTPLSPTFFTANPTISPHFFDASSVNSP